MERENRQREEGRLKKGKLSQKGELKDYYKYIERMKGIPKKERKRNLRESEKSLKEGLQKEYGGKIGRIVGKTSQSIKGKTRAESVHQAKFRGKEERSKGNSVDVLAGGKGGEIMLRKPEFRSANTNPNPKMRRRNYEKNSEMEGLRSDGKRKKKKVGDSRTGKKGENFIFEKQYLHEDSDVVLAGKSNRPHSEVWQEGRFPLKTKDLRKLT